MHTSEKMYMQLPFSFCSDALDHSGNHSASGCGANAWMVAGAEMKAGLYLPN